MKPDAEEIRSFLTDLSQQRWLGKPRRLWTKYSFHFTDIRNAASILRSGKLLSRAQLEYRGENFVDIASSEVINITVGDVKDCVRLYFRPKTPTQFRMEGIRPKSAIWKNSHCPVPVFFLFDSFSILSRDDSLFSEANLAMFGSYNSLARTAEELREFDFKKIFHVGWFSQDSRSEIVSRRNAEIIIPNELDLSALKFVYCRTPAEKETLLHLLPQRVRQTWAPRIIVATSADLFIRDRVFIDKVDLGSKGVTVHFSPEAKTPGPFDLRVVHRAGSIRTHTRNAFYAVGQLALEFREESWVYDIEVYLDDHLAFASTYDGSDDIPF